MRPFSHYAFTPTALNADGVCETQTAVGAGNLTIDGAQATAGTATFGEQSRVTLYSAGDLRGVTFTVTGTTARGVALSETMAGPNSGTVTTAANFKTVSRVAADAAVGTAVIVGNSNALETPWVALDVGRPLKGISVELSAGADLTYEIQYGAYAQDGIAEQTILALADATLTGKTASAGISALVPFPLVRVRVTEFVAGTVTLRVIQEES